jgi:signal transduction histidine kinase
MITASVTQRISDSGRTSLRLTHILINLVGSAIKFTDAGEVAIKAEGRRFDLWRMANAL